MFKIKKRYVKVIAITSFSMGVFALVSYVSMSYHTKARESLNSYEWYYNDDNTPANEGNTNTGKEVSAILEGEKEKDNKDEFVPKEIPIADKIDTEPDSITVLVNKELPLPEDYIPSDLVVPDVLYNFPYFDEKKQLRQEAASALEVLFQAAKEENHTLYAISGYRSYKRQYEIFTNNVINQGLEHTTKYSAIPGYSEHQTGLSMDVSTKTMRYRLEPSFANTKEGQWLAENAHKYGFIIRYPKDKSHITGYSYEPWHIRYVGEELAYYLYEENLTLEEYYNFTSEMDYSHTISYDNLIDYGIDPEDVIPPTKAPTKAPTPTPLAPEEEEESQEEDKDAEEGEDTDKQDEEQGDNKDKDKKDKDKDKNKKDKDKKDKDSTPTPTEKPTKAPTEDPEDEEIEVEDPDADEDSTTNPQEAPLEDNIEGNSPDSLPEEPSSPQEGTITESPLVTPSPSESTEGNQP